MSQARKYFGTDGIRGPVGTPPLTADFVMKLANAVGRVLRRGSTQRPTVIIGKDQTRHCGPRLGLAHHWSLASGKTTLKLPKEVCNGGQVALDFEQVLAQNVRQAALIGHKVFLLRCRKHLILEQYACGQTTA